MRYESEMTSLSWIPSEAVTGMNKAAFGAGFTHYDEPLPARIAASGPGSAEDLLAADRFRFGNVVAGWIEVADDGSIVDAGHCGRTLMGATTLRLGGREATFAAVQFPVIRDIETGPTWVRFVQTSGGRTAVPAPRLVRGAPFLAFEAPTVWTTLALTLHSDGRVEREMVGASPFPRHWIYDDQGELVAKAGLADFKEWFTTSFGRHTPWGDEDSAVVVTTVETALERELSTRIMRGGERPEIRRIKAVEALTVQGERSDEVFLLLNGVLNVEVDGEVVAQLGPGAVVGERAGLEGGVRTSTLRARTRATVAVARLDQLDPAALVELSAGHRREEVGSGGHP